LTDWARFKTCAESRYRNRLSVVNRRSAEGPRLPGNSGGAGQWSDRTRYQYGNPCIVRRYSRMSGQAALQISGAERRAR
jgi:hypothetical protein